MSGTTTFETTISAFGNNAGIVVPDHVLEELGAGRRPAVIADVSGHTIRTTLGVMGGRTLLGVNSATRAATGLAAGDTVTVTLTVDTEPRAAEVPPDLAEALDASGMRGFFDALAPGLQRMHVDLVEGAKTPETRSRRIEKAVALFAAGRKR